MSANVVPIQRIVSAAETQRIAAVRRYDILDTSPTSRSIASLPLPRGASATFREERA